ncbi:MAG: YIP1 family protein [Acidobacteriota bacterium]
MSDELGSREETYDDRGAASHGAPEGDAPTGAAAMFGPFFNAILAPAQTWEALDVKPKLAVWIVLWIMVLSTVISVINLPITQQIMVQSARAGIRAQGTDVSAEQLQQQAQIMTTFGTVAAYASSIFILVGLALIALLIWVLAAIMGGKGASFGRAFGVAAGAGVIHPLVYSVYASVIMHMNPPEIRRVQDASTVAPTLGLDLLLAGPDTPAWLEVLFQRIDLFSLWWAFLVVGGSMVVLKLKKGQAITVAFLIWLFFTFIAMGGAAVQGLAAG